MRPPATRHGGSPGSGRPTPSPGTTRGSATSPCRTGWPGPRRGGASPASPTARTTSSRSTCLAWPSCSSPTTLVIGDLPTATLRAYLALGDAAHDRIVAVWGEAQPAVIVAPSSLDALKAQLGPGRGDGFDQIAAVTDGPLVRDAAAQSDRVYLNPDAFKELSVTGRGVVVTHELTHVTVRASTSRSVPIWLSEGFADDVAIAPTGLSVRSVAADLLDQVRAGKGPTQLPDETAFDPAKGQIAPAYSAAWLAVSRMRQRYGQEKVVAFYRAVAGPKMGEPSVNASPDQLTGNRVRDRARHEPGRLRRRLGGERQTPRPLNALSRGSAPGRTAPRRRRGSRA